MSKVTNIRLEEHEGGWCVGAKDCQNEAILMIDNEQDTFFLCEHHAQELAEQLIHAMSGETHGGR